jgi:hypothetical protein
MVGEVPLVFGVGQYAVFQYVELFADEDTVDAFILPKQTKVKSMDRQYPGDVLRTPQL